MKRVFSILLLGVTMVSVTSCFGSGNVGDVLNKIKNLLKGNGEVVEEVVEEVAYEPVEEIVYEDRVYSNSYDGFTNVRKSASAKSTVLGKLRNGNEYVVVVGEKGNWYKVEYYGQTGYVHKDYVSHSPSKPVTVDVDANWLADDWSEAGYWGYWVHKNGKFDLWQQYGPMGSGTWRLEGNEIVFTLTKVTEHGREFDRRVGDTERFVINKRARMLGTMKPYDQESGYSDDYIR